MLRSERQRMQNLSLKMLTRMVLFVEAVYWVGGCEFTEIET